MRIAFCVAIKNRSFNIVPTEDSLFLSKHVAHKIQSCPQYRKDPDITEKGDIVLHLLPNMLYSLLRQKRPKDDWVLVVVDYRSEDVNVKELVGSIIGDILPYHVEVVEDYSFFDRGGGLAKAAMIAETQFKTDALFFLDADMLFGSRTVFDKAYDSLSRGQYYYPIFFSFLLPDHTMGLWRDTSFGNFACTVEDYKRTSGWLHNLSWGWEDNALNNSIPSHKKDRQEMEGFFHQWHPLTWEFRVKEYPIKQHLYKNAAVKELPKELR